MPPNEPEFMLDCLAGKLTTFDAICGYVSQLETQLAEADHDHAEATLSLTRENERLTRELAEAERKAERLERVGLQWKEEADETTAMFVAAERRAQKVEALLKRILPHLPGAHQTDELLWRRIHSPEDEGPYPQLILEARARLQKGDDDGEG